MLKPSADGNPMVALAPMSGVSDLPFRRLAHRLGATFVVSEMIASEELVKSRADVLRRAEGRELTPFVMQLAGREERWMTDGARIAEAKGADVIDINMGCPAKEVTGKLSGSAPPSRAAAAIPRFSSTAGSSRLQPPRPRHGRRRARQFPWRVALGSWPVSFRAK